MKKDLRVTGVFIHYYFVCKRKLWLFAKNLKMEEKSDLVTVGKLIDEYSFDREKKHINIDDTISIDFMGKEGTIHEVKKSKSMQTADFYQVKYYIFYLYKKGLKNIKGVIHYPKMKEKMNVELNHEGTYEMENIIVHIEDILKEKRPPEAKKTKICKKCSYFELCFI